MTTRTPLLEILADRIGIIGLGRDELLTPALTTRLAGRSCCFARREVEGDREFY